MAPDPLERSRQRQGPSLAFYTIGVQGYFSSVQPPLSEIPGSAPVFILFYKLIVENKIKNHTRKINTFQKIMDDRKKTSVFPVSLT